MATREQQLSAEIEEGKAKLASGELDPATTARMQEQIQIRQNELVKLGKHKQTIQTGVGIGKELIGDLGRAGAETQVGTGLGRADVEGISAEALRQGRSSDIADIIARRRAALGGFTGEETEQRRARAGQEIARQTQGQRRQIAALQAAQGVRGATAASQQIGALQQGIQTRAEFERDLFLANEEAKRSALSAFEQSVTSAERSEFERQAAGAELQKFNILQRSQAQQFNLGQELREKELQRQNLQAAAEQERFNLQQQAKERFGQVQTGLGFASLVAGEEASDKALAAQQAAASAAASGGK